MRMGAEKRAFKGIWICAAIFLDEKLTPAEKILLAEIDSLTTEDHGCYASNNGAILLKKVPTENTNRKTTTTHPDTDNDNGDSKKPAEASSRRCSHSVSDFSYDPPAPALGDHIAIELAAEFGLSSKQCQR